ncbi:MAG: NfeD family protein [Candidatus Hodarchaeales archaeon]
MTPDQNQVPITGIASGLVLIFLGSLLDIPLLYNLGSLIFSISIILIFVQWIITGGIVELLNMLPFILIFAIIITLASDFVSKSTETKAFTWPIVLIVLLLIITFFSTQGGDLSIIVPFIPIIAGLSIIGYVGGEIVWQDPLRGLVYGIGSIGILILLIWVKIRNIQKMKPVIGEKSDIIGRIGKTISYIKPNMEGRVKIGGTIWKARSKDIIAENEKITVVGISEDSLILDVIKGK